MSSAQQILLGKRFVTCVNRKLLNSTQCYNKKKFCCFSLQYFKVIPVCVQYSSFCSGCHSISFPRSGGPCWLNFGWLSSPPPHTIVTPLSFLQMSFSRHNQLACSQLWEENKHRRTTNWEVLSKEQFAQHKSFCWKSFEWEAGGHCGNNLAFSLKNYRDRSVEYWLDTGTRGFVLKHSAHNTAHSVPRHYILVL